MTYFRFKFKFVTFLMFSAEDVNSFSVGQPLGNGKNINNKIKDIVSRY